MLIPIEKVVGLFCSDYALCHIYVNKNFFECGEVAAISVHIDNSRVRLPCHLTISQVTEIICKRPIPGNEKT